MSPSPVADQMNVRLERISAIRRASSNFIFGPALR
jgi:hypothetical protein